jgi:hypothetical protein
MNYQFIVDNPHDVDAVLEQVRLEIKRNHLSDYIVMLGDSVFYGSPGPSDSAPSKYMERYAKQDDPAKAPVIFNLAFPSEQFGDMYTMLLMMDKLGISSDHVVLNVRYPSVRPRDSWPPAVFWWKEDLRKLDSAAFEHVRGQLADTGYTIPKQPYKRLQYWLKHDVLPPLKPFAYKDYLHKMLYESWLRLTGEAVPDDALDEPASWTTKSPEYIAEYLKEDEITADYADTPFDMTENNPDIYFMNRIVQHQQGKDTLVVMTPHNEVMLKDFIRKPGFQRNDEALKNYLKSLPVRYVDLSGKIPSALFTDHTHFTPEGYELLARLIWNAYKGGDRP